MTPADFQLLRETRDLLTAISESLVESAARVNDAIPELNELHRGLTQRDGDVYSLNEAQLLLLLATSGFVVLTNMQYRLREMLAGAGALTPELN